MTHHAPLTLVVGLGNPILSDDAVGWRVVEALETMLGSLESSVTLAQACVGGLSLAEMMVGYQHVIVVDAMMTGKYAVGTVKHLPLTDLSATLNVASAHDTNLITALDALRQYGAALPTNDAIHVIAIESRDVWTFAEQCSPEVEASIPGAAGQVLRLLGKIGVS